MLVQFHLALIHLPAASALYSVQRRLLCPLASGWLGPTGTLLNREGRGERGDSICCLPPNPSGIAPTLEKLCPPVPEGLSGRLLFQGLRHLGPIYILSLLLVPALLQSFAASLNPALNSTVQVSLLNSFSTN